jgi:DNA-binding transcriptional LysR family regulator
MIQLAEELANGEMNVALVTLPVNNPRLCLEVIRRDRLVVCLRREHELAANPSDPAAPKH